MNEKQEEIKGYKRKDHSHRHDLAGEHRLSDIGQLILLVSFLILWVLDSFVFRFSTFPSEYIPNYVRGILACPTLILAGTIAWIAHEEVFGKERAEPELIKTGVFSVIRHPMYLGAILLYLGLFVATFSLASLGFIVIIVIFYNCIASYEERILVAQFGEEYEEYRRNVAKWIPGLKFKKK